MWGCAFHHSALNRFHIRNPCLANRVFNQLYESILPRRWTPTSQPHISDASDWPNAGTAKHIVTLFTANERSEKKNFALQYYSYLRCDFIQMANAIELNHAVICFILACCVHIVRKQQYIAEFSPMACYLCHFNII